MSSDIKNLRPDAPWRSAGIGLGMGWRCMGCNVSRSSTLGSRGAGIKKRCAVCVAAKAKREGVAG